jgi:23S rRNA (uracil1939-C5)-methyltransferase
VKKNIKNPFYPNVTISDIGAEGKSLAKINDLIVFTTQAIPGDIVDLQVVKKKRRYQEARVVKIHEYSTLRAEPFCEHFGVCGGCKWQNLDYNEQLRYKQKQVEDQLQRIGKITIPEFFPILGSNHTTFYRNKLEFTFSNKRWLTESELYSESQIENKNALGFHIPGLFDKVLQINHCWLQPEPSNDIRNFIYNYAIDNGLSFFDIKKQEGFLRTLIIRTSSIGEVMVIVTFYYDNPEKRNMLLNSVKKEFPEITSLMYVVNQKGNDTITDQEVVLFSGLDHIREEMEGLMFKIGPKSFYQTNSGQAYELYKIAREFAALTGNETVYDLYTGTGTIANFIARNCKKVIGIEYVPEAIDDARINSEINQIGNSLFFAGDIKNMLNSEFIGEHGKPDVIITDPPRSGMHEDVIKAIIEAAPGRIVYVSCNPATQARDLNLMSEDYKVGKVQPVDMFPHTHHVENVVLLIKKE